jgi:hypothetical protein
MTTPNDVVSVPESFSLPPVALDDDQSAASAFQEINERRARVENAELLAHLRGL